jgi:hypothetical protein
MGICDAGFAKSEVLEPRGSDSFSIIITASTAYNIPDALFLTLPPVARLEESRKVKSLAETHRMNSTSNHSASVVFESTNAAAAVFDDKSDDASDFSGEENLQEKVTIRR